MSFDLALIRRFEAVYRRGSFSRAAEELGLTHSAMTKSIHTLEEQWNVRLFERTTRSVLPTAAGRRLAELAPELLAHAEQGKAQVLAASRRLSIACGPAVIDSFIPAALLELHRDRPDTTIEAEILPPDLAVERLVQRRAQLLLYHEDSVAAFGARRDLTVRRVVTEPYYLLCTSDHPAAAAADFAALLGHDWAIAGFDPSFAANLDPQHRAALRRAGFPRFRLSSQNACIQLAKSGSVVTMAPRSAALSAGEQEGLIARELAGAPRLTLTAVTLADVADHLVDAMIAALIRAVAP